MTINIKTTSGKSFEQLNDESILSSAEKAGINFQYSCKTGRCSSCKCKLISGEVNNYSDQIGLSDEDKKEGYILSCISYAIKNIEIQIEDLGDIKLPKPLTVPCKIDSLKKVSEDILVINLRTPPNSNISFIPGQYIDMIGPEGVKRSYSIANNLKDGLVELHVKRVIDGTFSNYWFSKAVVNDLLRLNGPHGTFFLRENNKGVIFLATGTGIAPIKSILDSLSESQSTNTKSIYLIWGGRNMPDLYIDFAHMYKKLDLKFIPVLSQPSTDWNGEVGYVQDALIRQNLDLANYSVYACGLDKMIADSRNLLINNGLKLEDFHSDAFVASSDIISS